MSKAVKVLEQMGSDAAFKNGQNEQAIKQLLIETEIDAEQTEAIVNKDVISLERQMDVCPDIVCLILPAEDDDKEEKNDDNDDNDSTEETSNRVIGF